MDCIVIESDDDDVEFVSSTVIPKKPRIPMFMRNNSEVDVTNVPKQDTLVINNVSNSDKENNNTPNGRVVKLRRFEIIRLDDDDDEDILKKSSKQCVSDTASVDKQNSAEQYSVTSNHAEKVKPKEVEVSDDSDIEIINVINKSPKRNNNKNQKVPTPKKSIPLQINKVSPSPTSTKNISTRSRSCPTSVENAPKPSISKTDETLNNLSKDEEQDESDDENEDPLKKLRNACRKGDLGNLMEKIDIKITKCTSMLRTKMSDPSFLELVAKVTKEIKAIVSKKNLKQSEKLSIAYKIKMILQEVKRGSLAVTKKINLLYKLFDKCQKRIEQIEEMEVESDDENENAYVLLGRYRDKATQIYNKICELEEKAPHADRQYLQRFTYCGKGPIEIQRALEKYYNTTRKFPNFKTVFNIVRKINGEKSLNLSSFEVYDTAKQMFIDFSQKLKNRRQLDEYHIMVGYIEEGHRDPATYDHELKIKLDRNKHLWATTIEQVIDYYAKKQTEQENNKRNKRVDNKNIKTDNNTPIASTSSANISGNYSESDQETITSDSEMDEGTEKNIFSDSEEEKELFTINKDIEKKRKQDDSNDKDNNKKTKFDS